MYNAIKLNKVDEHIKAMMLMYPSIIPSRFAALQQLFLSNGNGYEWNDKGELANRFDPPSHKTPGVMDYSDLDKRREDVEERLEKMCGEDCCAGLYQAWRCRLEHEYMVRRHIEANIDIYATRHVHGEETQYDVARIKHFDPDWCVLSLSYSHKFPEMMDKDWALAAEEAMTIARGAIYRELYMYSDNFSREKADPKWLAAYDKIGLILDRLDKFTGTKRRIAEDEKLVSELIAEIKKQESSK